MKNIDAKLTIDAIVVATATLMDGTTLMLSRNHGATSVPTTSPGVSTAASSDSGSSTTIVKN